MRVRRIFSEHPQNSVFEQLDSRGGAGALTADDDRFD